MQLNHLDGEQLVELFQQEEELMMSQQTPKLVLTKPLLSNQPTIIDRIPTQHQMHLLEETSSLTLRKDLANGGKLALIENTGSVKSEF
jgi:hypothetical protein